MTFISDTGSALPWMIAVFVAAALLSLALTPVVRRLVTRQGLIDRPEARRVNTVPIPRAGGLAVAAAFLLVAAIFVVVNEQVRMVRIPFLLTDGELHVLAIFDKPDPLDGPFFEETIYVTPSRLPADVQAAIVECAAAAAAALGLREGPMHAELRVNTDGPWIVEVAGRSVTVEGDLPVSTNLAPEAALAVAGRLVLAPIPNVVGTTDVEYTGDLDRVATLRTPTPAG